ncbi:hypothetical protein IV43_GL000032 [Ligilactobacillus acidipiscis]|uniref:Uncharacterized protein n=2 Tax=Ligilactobacillus acidipiscis TaxID=89059 RepID=A0A0R2KKW3_9LACO|nr:hypothetical protein IV43_GL000032 [Ligilactobacillus acidipiscis]
MVMTEEKVIKISSETFDSLIIGLASNNPYKRWLHENHLKGNIVNAAKFVLDSAGSYNAAYNSLIEEKRTELQSIVDHPDYEVRVIRRVIEIYTIDYGDEEHIKLLND